MLIPQMEIPGEVPPGYILRHPVTEKVEVYKLVLSAVMVSYIYLLRTVSQNLKVRCRVLVHGGWLWGGVGMNVVLYECEELVYYIIYITVSCMQGLIYQLRIIEALRHFF